MTDHDDPAPAETTRALPIEAPTATPSWLLVATMGSMAVAALLLIDALADATLRASGRPGWLLAVLLVQLVLILALWRRWDEAVAHGTAASACAHGSAGAQGHADPRAEAGGALPRAVADELAQLRASNREWHRRAMYDSLTGLPNRALFEELVDAELSISRRHGRRLALLFIDLDRFKAVNDALGHAAGDQLLQAVTRRMREELRESDVACRLAGDEFVLLLRDAGPRAELAALCERLLASLARPHSQRAGAITVTASAGIACYPHDGADAASLLAAADAAMYEAKHAGRNQWRFHSFDAEAYDALPPGPRRLAQALLRDELVLHFQPVCRGDGTIVGAEALVRWPMDGGRLVGAGDFIAMAERSGLITDLGDWTLRQACRHLAHWRAAGHALPLAINVSALELRDISLPERVADALTDAGLSADALELEITETALMHDGDATRHLIERLHALGVRLTIDDFGVGYSSLAQLRQLRPGRIKIDRSFVSACEQDADSRALLAALIALAHSLHIEVVAEGVETPAQRAFLMAQGCDLMQGHGLARPMPAEELERLLCRSTRLALHAA